MKRAVTLLSFLLLLVVSVGAQNITGIWKGHFVQKSFGYFEDRYRFEIQIEQLANNALKGVTYSYKTTVFYGKADLKGIYTKKTKNIVFNETKLLEVKIGEQSQPCLMTCYLEYSKLGKIEVLSGTYTSRSLNDGGDCGSGKVYLEKATESDFKKEEFLVRREKRTTPTTKAAPKAPVKKPAPKTPTPAAKAVSPKVKPGAEENVIVKKQEPKNVDLGSLAPSKKEEIVMAPPRAKPLPPRPEILKKRSNELAKTITISSKEMKIDLYDNGEIDGDSISVYHNNRLIVNKRMLTHKPISFTILADENDTHHEFVLVAENLGSIPPNTALMIITAGGKRHELFITSTEQKNAMVVIEYKPQD